MIQIPTSTSRVAMLKLFLTGTTTAATGKTLAIVLSKAGGAFANPNAGATNATEVSNGWYKVTLDTTDTATLGDLVVRGTASGCDDAERIFGVVSAATGGLTNLDTTVSSRGTSTLTQTQVSGGAYALNSSSFAYASALDFTTTQKTSIGTAVAASAVASVTGAVGSIGSGGITSSTFAAGAIDASAIAANAIGASELATDAVSEIAAGVWDLATSGHTTSGTFGAAMAAAGAAGDPWSTSLPASYGAGTAGFYVGTYLNSSVAAVKTDTASIKTKTDNLPGDPADASDVAALIGALPTAAQNAAGLLDLASAIETGLTMRGAMRLIVAANAGKVSGAETTSVIIRNAVADSKARITATVDSNGNRTVVATDAT